MSELSPVQRRIARILFDLPEATGYALAGGAALIIRKVVTRETRDLDAFIGARPGPDPGTVDALANALLGALHQYAGGCRRPAATRRSAASLSTAMERPRRSISQSTPHRLKHHKPSTASLFSPCSTSLPARA